MLHFVVLLTLFQPLSLPHCRPGQSSDSGMFNRYGLRQQDRCSTHPFPIRPDAMNLASRSLTAATVP